MKKRTTLTEISFKILRWIILFRFATTAMLMQLVRACKDTIYEQLDFLYETGFVNFYKDPISNEHNHYIDTKATLNMMYRKWGFVPSKRMYSDVRSNRLKDYAQATQNRSYGQLAFAGHDLDIIRLHFMAEQLAKKYDGVEFADFRYQSELGHHVIVRKVNRNKKTKLYEEQDEHERLSGRFDGLLTLALNDQYGRRLVHFPIEWESTASRNNPSLVKKFRREYHLIRQRKHIHFFGLKVMRAILVIAVDEAHKKKLMRLAVEAVGKPNKPLGLFWFTTADNFKDYLTKPEILLAPIWDSPADQRKHALTDLKNWPVPQSPAGNLSDATAPTSSQPQAQTRVLSSDLDPLEDIY